MGSTTLVPVAEYLSTSYRPDMDYLEGELQERSVGELPHGKLQMYIGFVIITHPEWKLEAIGDQRVQVRPTRYRIPDVCVIRSSDPADRITTVPPILCVEILSSGDSLNSTRPRVNDFLAMGVENVWIFDPWKRLAYYADDSGYHVPQDGFLRIPETEVAISVSEAFAFIDRRP